MTIIYELIPEEFIKAIGWTIFHSLWQGAVISVLLAGVLLMTGKKSAQLRYNLTVTALFFMFGISIITFTQVYSSNAISNSERFESASASNTGSNVSEQPDSAAPNSNEDLTGLLKSYFAQNLPMIVTIWFLGFFVFSFRFAGGVFYVQRLRSKGISPVDDPWFYRLEELTARFKLKKLVQIFESEQVKTPITIGYLKPLILLPIGMISGLPQEQVEAIIIHELAHIKRYDFLINLVQTFIETIFFYHPAVWWISSTIKNERENCCDDLTLKLCGGSLIYFKALYNLQQICSEENEIALAVIGKKNQLFRRINRMNSNNKITSYGVKFTAFAVLLLIIAAASVYSTSSAKENTHSVIAASFVNPLSFAGNNIFTDPSCNTTFDRDTTSIKKGKRTLKFSDDDKRYKAKLNNGKLEDLSIDGEKVDEKELPKYDTMVNDRLNEYDSSMKEFRENMKDYKEKMKVFKEKMKKFRGSHNFDYNYDFDFEMPAIPDISVNIPDMDTTQWKKMAKEIQYNVQENLARHMKHMPKIHIPPIHVPRIDMKEFKHGWDSTEFNNEEFKESMKDWKEKFSKEMANWKVDMKDFKVNMEKFNKEMKENGPGSDKFKKSMSDLKVNMDNLKVEMKKLKEFIHATKDELVKDNLIKEGDDLDDFTLSKDEMIVAGKKVSPELHKKYLELYKKYFGREITGDQKFRIND
ncbi:MAG: M56 family metallopeptidase [Ignavibacteriales bacterium]|nr:M56 family metallopeptidase [Ignavibacteriales bacterium]